MSFNFTQVSKIWRKVYMAATLAGIFFLASAYLEKLPSFLQPIGMLLAVWTILDIALGFFIVPEDFC